MNTSWQIDGETVETVSDFIFLTPHQHLFRNPRKPCIELTEQKEVPYASSTLCAIPGTDWYFGPQTAVGSQAVFLVSSY